MNEGRFDRIAKGLSMGSSRRRLLAGLGAVTTGALVARGAAAAPSPKAPCMRACNATAKETRRGTCADLVSKDKRDCLKDVKADRAVCRQDCRAGERR